MPIYALGKDGRVWVSTAAMLPRQLLSGSGLSDVVELAPGTGTLEWPLCARFRDLTVGCWATGEKRRVGRGSPTGGLQPALLRQNFDASRPISGPPEED
jgi:hypothetical protein